MAKDPTDSEVILYGEKVAPKPQRAEIISFDKDGNTKVAKGGVSRTPMKERKAPVKPPPKAPPPTPTQPVAAASETPPPAAVPSPSNTEKPTPKGAPKRNKPKVGNPASAKDVSAALVTDTVGSLVGDLRAKAQAKGGMLSLDDLDAMEAELAQRTKAMQAQFETAFEDYAVAVDKLRWSAERGDPFYRLLIKQFSHLFKEQVSSKTISRRLLPGFFMAAGMLLGPDVVERNHDRCGSIVARLKMEVGEDNFDWEIFYTAQDALTVSLDAQLLMAARFADYDKRMAWFIDLVNSHLAAEAASEADRHWQLTEHGARRMIDALTSDLRKVLSAQKGRERLVKRHGADSVTDAISALKRLVTG